MLRLSSSMSSLVMDLEDFEPAETKESRARRSHEAVRNMQFSLFMIFKF